MKDKIILTGLIILLVLSIFSVYVVKSYNSLKVKYQTKIDNFDELYSKTEQIKNENGTYLIKLKEFEYTKEELEKSNKNLVNKIISLGIKVKDLQSITTTCTESTININAILNDTIGKIKIKYIDSLGKLAEKYELKKIKDFNYFDPYYKVKGFIYDSLISLKINHIDSIFIINHRYKKCKLPIIKWFYKWNYRTDITNSDTTTKLITPIKIDMIDN